MLIIPAIDLRGGCVVRLEQGILHHETVYSSAPEEIAKKWQQEGAKLIHVVDLDGAFHGKRKNLGSLKNILQLIKIPIEFGGGLRTLEDVDNLILQGISRVIIGTKAFDTPFMEQLVSKHHEKIAVGIDVKDNVIKTHGWLNSGSSMKPEQFCKTLEKIGVKTIIFTDVSRDGMLKGPNFEALEDILSKTKLDVIASGGVSQMEDLERLCQIKASNLVGVIVGKALYEQKINLKAAIENYQR